MKNKFNGLGVALVTPFAVDGENGADTTGTANGAGTGTGTGTGAVDFVALERLVDYVIAGGVDYIVALGTTAETPTLSRSERAQVAKTIRERAGGRVPLIIGMGGNNTAALCEELRAGELTKGFDAVLSVVPYYNKPSQDGLYQHFKAVCEASPLPVVLYNIPGRTGVNMLPQTTLRIAREVRNAVGVKEASGNIDQMRAIIEGAPNDFLVLSGDDGMTIPLMRAGGHGVISVIANVLPREFAAVVGKAKEGDFASAERLWAPLDDVCKLLFAEGNPTGVKTALAARGICSADVRLPLVKGTDELQSAIRVQFRNLGI